MFEELVRALQCGKPRCECARWHGTGNLHCAVKVAHKSGDAHPSLTVTVAGDRITWNCKSGCSQADVREALTELRVWPPPKEAAPAARPGERERPRRLVAEYPYKDGLGTVIAYKGRFEYGDAEGGKTFLWRREGSDRWGGLQGIAMEELPLYNLEGVLDPDAASEIVYFVEGEKAADACIEHGLVAVSLGGGANQQQFGHALDQLLKRDVVLWPDNDEPGYALMARLAAALPRARFLKLPDWMPPKGDAYDFFADREKRGGVALIAELVQHREPKVTWDAEEQRATVEIWQPEGAVMFSFNDWHLGPNKIEVNCRTSIGGMQDEEHETENRVNLLSLSDKDRYRLLLDKFFTDRLPGKNRWTVLFERAARLANNTYSTAARSVDLADIRPDYTALYRLEGIIPEGVITTFFAPGGAGKTNIVMDIAVGLSYEAVWLGRPGTPGVVLYVDYEGDAQSITRRYWRILQGHDKTPDAAAFHYWPARGRPFANIVQAVKAEMKRVGADILIIDSAGPACGGKPEDSDAALGMFNAIHELHCTTLLITHVNRQGDKFSPFGSSYWRNETRALWYVEQVGHRREANDLRYIDLVAYNRKMNDDDEKRPIPISIEFDGATGPIRVRDGTGTAAETSANEPHTQTAAVLRAIDDATQQRLRPTTAWIVDQVAGRWPEHRVSVSRARTVLSDLKKRGIVGSGKTPETGKDSVWWIVTADEPPEADAQERFFDDAPPLEDGGFDEQQRDD